MRNVEDVTDAQSRFFKGKLPRNIVYILGGVAAFLIAGLGYYYQSRTQLEMKEQAEQRKAEELKARTSAPDNARTLARTIREQQEAARAEAARQQASAVPAEPSKSPVMTAKDFSPAGAATTPQLAEQNKEDNLFTAPLTKGGGGKLQAPQRPALSGIPDPTQLRAVQEAAVAAANARSTPVQEAAAVSSDKQFLREAEATTFQRTGIVGKLPDCTVSKGFVIPATFVGGNNSDKPGEFRAMVSQNVYDTIKGTCLAVPVGSVLVGTYSPDIAIGQERLLVAFTRLQLPNGNWVPLLGSQGTDPNGESGVSGNVNNHWLKIFGGAFVIAVLEQRFNNQSIATTPGPTGLTTYGNAAGQVATQTAQTILNRNQSIRPTITTKPGDRLLMQVKHDIVMEPYVE